MKALGFTFSNGTTLCAEHATDVSDPGNESGEAYAIYNTEERHSDLICDECEEVILAQNTED